MLRFHVSVAVCVLFCWMRKLNLPLNKHILEKYSPCIEICSPKSADAGRLLSRERTAHKLVFSETSRLQSWQINTLNFGELNFEINKYILKQLFSQMSHFFHLSVFGLGFVGFFWRFFSNKIWCGAVVWLLVFVGHRVTQFVFHDFVLETWRAPRWMLEERQERQTVNFRVHVSYCACYLFWISWVKDEEKGKNSHVVSSLNFMAVTQAMNCHF